MWGQLNFGPTSSAFDGPLDADLSADVGLAGLAATSVGTYGSAVGLRTGAAGVSVGDVHSPFDGGREDLVRYGSPGLGPFSATGKLSVRTRVSGYQPRFRPGCIKSNVASRRQPWHKNRMP